MIGPDKPLPLPRGFSSTDEYVDSLIHFLTSSQTLQTLCGGVHILDFFTRSPDLYSTIIPQDWREWFDKHDINDILDFLNKEDASQFLATGNANEQKQWRGASLPPVSLVHYVHEVQRHCLITSFTSALSLPTISQKAKSETKYIPSPKAMIQGMNPKKLHEVSNFAHFVSDLSSKIGENSRTITHIVDFGSGQNYLGRTLASEPYCKDIIAVESRPHVVKGAMRMDSRVNLVDQKLKLRNKKEFRKRGRIPDSNGVKTDGRLILEDISNTPAVADLQADDNILRVADASIGKVQYIEHRIQDGDLSDVVKQISRPTPPHTVKKDQITSELSLMVISLHSCGNLLHHGLRALTLNPSVRAVALIGCCYNLLTERQGPPTYKVPLLRENHPRLYAPESHNDPHGFPMSFRLLNHRHPRLTTNAYTIYSDQEGDEETGIHLNITARMMAVQAPQNWTQQTSASFFTRHFYRALLQRILMERGVVAPPEASQNIALGRSPAGTGSTAVDGTAPVIIGNLAKGCYEDIVTYVRGAVAKLQKAAEEPKALNEWTTQEETTKAHKDAITVAKLAREKVGVLTDEDIRGYENRYTAGKKHLAVIWSLMAFSAQIIEAVIVVDRYLWLTEQDCVQEAWVQTAFEYMQSPRNMVVIGIKKTQGN
jgi:hypothetical protein